MNLRLAWARATLPASLRHSTAIAVAAGGTAVIGAAVSLAASLGLGAAYTAQVAILFAAVALGVIAGISQHLPHALFGVANAITLARALGVCLIGGLVGTAGATAALGWTLTVALSLLLALDGLDGWAARRRGTASAFGARFDMEVDSLLLLVLSVLALAEGRVGVWVLAIGLTRYLFVLAGRAWPWLERPLPPSWRRKAVCVAAGIALIAALSPVASVAVPAAAIGTLLIVASFAVDTVWLQRRRRDA